MFDISIYRIHNRYIEYIIERRLKNKCEWDFKAKGKLDIWQEKDGKNNNIIIWKKEEKKKIEERQQRNMNKARKNGKKKGRMKIE